MPKTITPAEATKAKQPREKKVIAKVVKEEPKAVTLKKTKETKILKKIEDFNKFARIRAVKEAKMKLTLGKTIVFDSAQVLKAVKCLQKLSTERKEKSKLLLEEDDEFLYVEVTLSKVPQEYSIRPY